MPSGEAHEVINLTDDIVPPRGARIEVYAWPEQGKDAATLTLGVPEGTLEEFEKKLRDKGYQNYRVRQLSGAALEGPPARYRFVAALPIRKNKASSSGSRAARGGETHQTPRQRVKYQLTCSVSVDLLTKVIAPDFTPAQGIKEIIDNSVQSLVFLFQVDNPGLASQEKPQIVILIDLQRGVLRVVDNGGGCTPSPRLRPSTTRTLSPSHAQTLCVATGSTRSK